MSTQSLFSNQLSQLSSSVTTSSSEVSNVNNQELLNEDIEVILKGKAIRLSNLADSIKTMCVSLWNLSTMKQGILECLPEGARGRLS